MSPSQSAPAPKRICQVIHVKKEALESYKEIHRNAWPSVLDRLRQSHIVDYSINLLPSPPYAASPDIAGLLIATFKYVGNDFDADMAQLVAYPETRRWWSATDSMQSSLIEGATGSEGGAWWYDCEEVFRME